MNVQQSICAQREGVQRKCDEFLYIEGDSDRVLDLRVFAYSAGTVTVNFEWGY